MIPTYVDQTTMDILTDAARRQGRTVDAIASEVLTNAAKVDRDMNPKRD